MRCIHCKIFLENQQALLCRSCFKDFSLALLPRSFPPQYICNIPLFSFGLYQGALASFIKAAKSQPFGYCPNLVQGLTKELCLHWKEEIMAIDLIAHVPGQPLRCWIQTDFTKIIAQNLGTLLQVPVTYNLFLRSWTSSQQKSHAKSNRHFNKKNIRLNKNAQHLSTLKVLLIDDVCTSGESLSTCIKILRSAGFSVRACLTFARTELFFYDYKLKHENHY